MNDSQGGLSSVLILGLGNDILGDDAIGLRVVDEMQIRFGERFDWQKCTMGGLDILEIIRGYDHLVMIDAIKTGNRKPGTLFFLTPGDFSRTLHIANFHDINILNAIEIGKRLGMKMPGRIDIIAIEILEDKEFSSTLTPILSGAFERICSETESWMRSELVRK